MEISSYSLRSAGLLPWPAMRIWPSISLRGVLPHIRIGCSRPCRQLATRACWIAAAVGSLCRVASLFIREHRGFRGERHRVKAGPHQCHRDNVTDASVLEGSADKTVSRPPKPSGVPKAEWMICSSRTMLKTTRSSRKRRYRDEHAPSVALKGLLETTSNSDKIMYSLFFSELKDDSFRESEPPTRG